MLKVKRQQANVIDPKIAPPLLLNADSGGAVGTWNFLGIRRLKISNKSARHVAPAAIVGRTIHFEYSTKEMLYACATMIFVGFPM